MAGSGSLFFRERVSHGKTERRWVASMRIGRKRPTMACSHDHKPRDGRQPCPESVAHLDTLRRQREGLAPLDLRTLTVGRFLQRWVSRLDLRPATIRQHEMIVRVHLEPAFRGRLLTQLVASDVDAYLDRNDLDPQTLRHHRATLRRALADAVRDGYIDRNPAALSHAPRMQKAERRYLTAPEARRLVDSSRGDRLWPLWTLLVSTGLRLSEALGLAWSDVTSETITIRHQLARVDGTWTRPEPKTRKSRRTVTLIPLAAEALRVQKAQQEADLGDHPTPIDGLVFTTASGRPIHGTNVLPAFRKALAAAGLPRITLHDLRHSYATVALAAGVPIPVIAATLGHSSIRVTADLYAHVTPELHNDAARRVAEALA